MTFSSSVRATTIRRLLCLTAAVGSMGLIVAWQGPALAQSPATAPAYDAAFDSAIAERFAYYGTAFLRGEDTPDAQLSLAAGLYSLASSLNPNETRFLWPQATANQLLGREKDALAALAAIRKIDPRNEQAQVRTLDLALNGIETAEKRVDYLKQVASAGDRVSSDVRSHAAIGAYTLLLERGQTDAATAMLDLSLQLNPQNIPALNAKLTKALNEGTPVDRAKALQALLVAAPYDTSAIVTLGHLCAAHGAHVDAGNMYMLALNLNNAMGAGAPPVDDIVSLVSSSILARRHADAEQLVSAMLQGFSSNADLHTLKLLNERLGKANAEAYVKIADDLRGTWLGRLSGISIALNDPKSETQPTTLPSQPLPPIDADVAKVVALNNEELTKAYAEALDGLIWHDQFVRKQAADPSLTRALANLVTEQSALYALHEGWRLLRNNDLDGARAKLTPLAAADDLAELGLIEVERAAGNVDAAKSKMLDLLKRRPVGFEGVCIALISDELGVTLDIDDTGKQLSEVSQSIAANISAFLNNPRDFYNISIDPVKVSFEFGEPMLAKLTVRGSSARPVTIGRGAMVSPVLWIDGVLQGSGGGALPALGVLELNSAIRLDGREQFQQMVRLDQLQGRAKPPSLDVLFNASPGVSLPMKLTALVNPVGPAEQRQPGAGGFAVSIGTIVERRAAPVNLADQRQQWISRLSTGTADQRTRAFELLLLCEAPVRAIGLPDSAAAADEIKKALDDAYAKESDPRVKDWMWLARTTRDGSNAKLSAEQQDELRARARSSDPHQQAIALLAGLALSKAEQQSLSADVLASNPSPAIADIATGLAQLPDMPTTAPAAPAN
jgi:hypothetical protein